MQVFLIHRSADKAAARRLVKAIEKERQIALTLFVLDSSKNDEWKQAARTAIDRSEAVIVFNKKACLESENATWEIGVAKELNKPLVFLDSAIPDKKELDTLCAVYNHDQEFDSYFRKQKRTFICRRKGSGKEKDKDKDKDIIELYKTIVASSEQLIQRRQSMNAFFIAAIGSLLAFAGALVKFGNIDSKSPSFLIFIFLAITGLILCHSWRNLIDNYGKLNKAKFRVITKIEESLPAQIFSAEWAALGKGSRPDKYKPFTSTEQYVPWVFAMLIVALVVSILWYASSPQGGEKRDGDLASTLACSVSVRVEKQNDVKDVQALHRCPPVVDQTNGAQANQVKDK